MDNFEEIKILLNRAFKLQRRINELQFMCKLDNGAEPRSSLMRRIKHADRLIGECRKRARHKFLSAKHEAYNEGRRNFPAYRKRFTN